MLKFCWVLYSIVHVGSVSSIVTEAPCEAKMMEAYDKCLYPKGIPVAIPSNKKDLAPPSNDVIQEEPTGEEQTACLLEAVKVYQDCWNRNS